MIHMRVVYILYLVGRLVDLVSAQHDVIGLGDDIFICQIKDRNYRKFQVCGL